METKVFLRLINAKKSFPSILKDTKAFNYKYANLTQIIDAISNPLWDNSLDFLQEIVESKLNTYLVDCMCDDMRKYLMCSIDIILDDKKGLSDIQKYGSAITYLRRYSLMTAFGLASEDDDGASASNILRSNNYQKPQPKAENKPVLNKKDAASLSLIHSFVKANDYINAAYELHAMSDEGKAIIKEPGVVPDDFLGFIKSKEFKEAYANVKNRDIAAEEEASKEEGA